MTHTFNPETEKMSASRMFTILSCPRKYVYKYVLGLPDSTSKAAATGKAFHSVLEGKEIGGDGGLEELETKIVHKMARNHAYATRTLDPVRFKEVKFENDKFLGFVDAVRVDKEECWSIAERKTASDLARFETATRDLQLCAYTTHKKIISEATGLDINKFKGIDLEVTLKPTEKLKKSETVDEFVARASVYTEVKHVPATESEAMTKHFNTQQTFSAELRKVALNAFDWDQKATDVPCNQNSCKLFNSKCAYFENCYGVK